MKPKCQTIQFKYKSNSNKISINSGFSFNQNGKAIQKNIKLIQTKFQINSGFSFNQNVSANQTMFTKWDFKNFFFAGVFPQKSQIPGTTFQCSGKCFPWETDFLGAGSAQNVCRLHPAFFSYFIIFYALFYCYVIFLF